MNQQPDKLFRERLESFSRPAPASAWDRIEAGLDKKDNKGLWWKVAASLLVLMVAGYILWLSAGGNRTTPTTQPVAETPHAKPDHKPALTEQIPSIPNNDPAAEKTEQVKPPIYTAKSSAQVHSQTTSEKYIPKSIAEEPKQKLAEAIPAPYEKTESTTQPVIATTEPAIAQNEPVYTSQQKSITIVITAAETDNYLNKNVSDEATDEDDKPSTFKKLLQKAQDLKNNQDPFGELRQKKNEILALNFKNEKRGQNK
ncbi:MAG TPA: hypothetical protein VIN08_23965 [Ohtaekwangia sp.]|uniref:hypothetical protein n=1 Tax=Ohtaekwangia sp. TaxID=2066019 RepID=UPI002F91D6A1